MDNEPKELKEYFANLTPEARDVISSPEWYSRVEQIGNKYSLSAEQINSLQYEILFILVGMEPDESLGENIQNELGISRLLAGQIVEEVNERIVSFIVDSVEKKTPQKDTNAIQNDVSFSN